jgi:hypothetical protein
MERRLFLWKLLVFAFVAYLFVASILCAMFPGSCTLEGIGWLLLNLPVRPLAPLWDELIFDRRILQGWIQWLSLAWTLLFLGAMIVICRFTTPSCSMLLLARCLVAAWLLSGGLTVYLQILTHC